MKSPETLEFPGEFGCGDRIRTCGLRVMSCGEPVFPAVFRHFYSIFPQKPEGLPLSVPLNFFGSGSENGSNTACGGVGVGGDYIKICAAKQRKAPSGPEI